MAQYLKIFGEDFENPGEGKPTEQSAPAPEPPPAITVADLDAAYARGLQDGESTALVQSERQSEEMIKALLLEIGTVTDTARKDIDEVAEVIVKLLLDLLQKFFPVLCKEYGPTETTDMVSIVLAGLIDEPTVEIRACPAGIAHLEQYLQATPYDGDSKLTLVTVDTMQPGDANMRWKNGKAYRNAAAMWDEILAALRLNGIIDPEPAPPKTRTLIGHDHG